MNRYISLIGIVLGFSLIGAAGYEQNRKLEARIAVLTSKVDKLDHWATDQIKWTKTQADWTQKETEMTVKQGNLLTLVAKEFSEQQKKKSTAGWVDCWTDNKGYRNCVDAQGNTSRRNF